MYSPTTLDTSGQLYAKRGKIDDKIYENAVKAMLQARIYPVKGIVCVFKIRNCVFKSLIK